MTQRYAISEDCRIVLLHNISRPPPNQPLAPVFLDMQLSTIVKFQKQQISFPSAVNFSLCFHTLIGYRYEIFSGN
jgi:hypothetical protein